MVSAHKSAGLPGGIDVQHWLSTENAASGTIETPAGPIDWSRSSDGTVRAHGNNQEFTTTVTNGAGGSSQRRLAFSRDGQAPYVTIEGLIDVPNRAVTLSMTAGASHLTLVVAGLDLAGRTGTATLTGILGGPGGSSSAASLGAAEAPHPGGPQTIHWAGPVDLGSPWPIHAWPPKAFAHELQMAAFFDPLATSKTGPAANGAPGGKVAFTDSFEATLEKALGATALGALGGLATGGPWGAAIGGLLGWDGVWISADIDLYNDWKNSQVDPIPPPPPDIQPDPEEPGTKSNSGSQDDPPPPPPPDEGDPPPENPVIDPTDHDPGVVPDPEDPGIGPDPDEGGGDGGGWKIDDTGPAEHPE
jgi:hypothetical protein